MSVAVRIQHVAGRVVPLDRLLAQLPPKVEVVTDSGDPPNPWRGYQKCLSDLPTSGHVCVIQDDAVVCRNFVPALDLIAAANPDVPVCLFLGGQPKRTAARMLYALRRGECYVDLVQGDFMPVVGILWPVQIAASFMQWADENRLRLPGGAAARSDDAVSGRWVRFSRQRVRVTVPSLVEHLDDVPSTIGRRARAGVDKGRVAVQWLGNDDPLLVNWG